MTIISKTMIIGNCDPPSVDWWTEAMTKADKDEALKLRDHAIRCLDHDNPNWSHLLTLGERILLERGIIVR